MSRPNPRTRSALAVVVSALVMLLAVPPQANAAIAHFSCTLLAPYTWCRHGTWHNYNAMGVNYPGSGSIVVCARMVRRVGGGVYTNVCGTNSAVSNFPRCNCGGLWNDIAHRAPNARNLKGWGAY